MNIEIYTKDFCIWCDRAKSLLESKNLSFTEIDLSDDLVRFEFYSKLGEDVKTVPQIFIDNKRIGGFQELVRWFGDGN
ncbi:glutaredoxin [Acidimicrobiia bacterium]|nr:glutaredoxin [Acidimicrobiia bacterium]MDA8667729.1 glutaredoxin 3 [Candidatus Actinomarina sp.]MDA8813132.1 glutaredoxin 3 [Candidatus Actinomarina sp.]MDA9198144.1 glutaredoxin [Acidimicrobiia bacterium]MDA9860100.1 glutaredoxin [Acidimicrobiia bacterium]